MVLKLKVKSIGKMYMSTDGVAATIETVGRTQVRVCIGLQMGMFPDSR